MQFHYWVPISKAEKILEIDRKDLHRMRKKGMFKLGTHFGAGPRTRSQDTFYWHIPSVREILKQQRGTQSSVHAV